MRFSLIVLGIALCIEQGAAAAQAMAGPRNDIPSCRAAFFHQRAAPSVRDLIIAVDRTVSLSPSLREDAVDRISRAIRPGDHLVIVTFSGLTKDEFTRVEFDGRVDTPATENELETKLPASKIDEAMQCFNYQLAFGKKAVRTRLTAILAQPLSDAQRSEILRALSTISTQMLSDDNTPTKLVVVVSDMLEFSDFASFYNNRRLRAIDPAMTMKAARAARLIGAFNGARVYVIGTAVPSNPREPGPGIRERQLLQDFWERWFKASNAVVVGLDNPELLKEIR